MPLVTARDTPRLKALLSANLRLTSGYGANVAYLDSHVEFMHASQFLLDSASNAPNGTTGPNELWWNPNSASGH